MRIMTRVPAADSPHVIAFCSQINPQALPVRLPIRAEPGCEVRECFHNVRRKVEREGGRICYGWEILEWPLVFIEAVHHAVYANDHGELADLTPPGPESQLARLFLKDETAAYDFERPDQRRDNIRQPLVQDPSVTEYLQLGSELLTIMNRTPNQGLVAVKGTDARRVELLQRRAAQLKLEIALRYTLQGEPCFCGSGEKFKRCHGTR